jgi:hypothetical protein
MTKEQEEQGFRVTDKRGYREDGETHSQESSENRRQCNAAGIFRTKAFNQEIPPGPMISSTSFYYARMCSWAVPNPYANKKEEDVKPKTRSFCPCWEDKGILA